MGAHLIGDNACQRGFPKPRRAIKQHMVQRFPSGLRRLDIHLQHFLRFLLADVILQKLGPEMTLYLNIFFRKFRCNHS